MGGWCAWTTVIVATEREIVGGHAPIDGTRRRGKEVPARARGPAVTRWIGVASVAGFVGVVLGAFGAHALKARLAPDLVEVWKTAVEYQFVHVAALLAVGILGRQAPSGALQGAGWCFTLGIVVFSGSLYALALSGVRVLGAVTPLGGLLFLAGWALLGWAAFRRD